MPDSELGDPWIEESSWRRWRPCPRWARCRPRPDSQLPRRHQLQAGRASPACRAAIPAAWSPSIRPRCIDEVTEKVDVPTVQAMIARGMTTLTGDKDPRDSWARFFNAQDFVGIKVNASGAPGAMSMPEVVAEIANNLIAVGVKPTNIVIHERGGGQILLPKLRPVRARRHPRGIGEHVARLRSGRLRRSQFLRRGGHALVPDPDGHRAVHEDHQRAEHEGPRRVGRDRLPEEHRLRRVQQRGALALPRADRDADVHRHAGDRRAAALAHGAEHHGRPARRLARGPVLAGTRSTASIRSR